ncbi:hypothetical protein SAMN05660284_00732 [Formivibrio citricus]|uniref:DUF4870 domain-containing protein n=1 Tax=Formivibrio citricus TaxID=83765 RepID=A0A1I4WTN2_9NEIS|nr:DUF4870 domain-containing protein [Formivibrio citricus]SFN17151.1 hypothetical protein SAMN05660284_00732 [Formivibrio citricus]
MDNPQPPVPQPQAGQTDAKTIAILVWIGTIFLGFIPSLIVFLLKKDDEFLLDHTREALNWSITVLVGWFASMILTFILIGLLGYLVLIVSNLVFCLMGAIKASNNQTFRAPVCLRLIK